MLKGSFSLYEVRVLVKGEVRVRNLIFIEYKHGYTPQLLRISTKEHTVQERRTMELEILHRQYTAAHNLVKYFHLTLGSPDGADVATRKRALELLAHNAEAAGMDSKAFLATLLANRQGSCRIPGWSLMEKGWL
jgi:hypothetical protein